MDTTQAYFANQLTNHHHHHHHLQENGFAHAAVVDSSTSSTDNDPSDDYYLSMINQKLNELTMLESEPSEDATSFANGNVAYLPQATNGDGLLFDNGTHSQFATSLPSLAWNVEHLQAQMRLKLASIAQGQARCKTSFGESRQQLQNAMQTIQQTLLRVQEELADQLEMGINRQMIELSQQQTQLEEAMKHLSQATTNGEGEANGGELLNFALANAKQVLETPVPVVCEPARLPPLDQMMVERALRSFFTRQPSMPQQLPSPSNSDHDSFGNMDNFQVGGTAFPERLSTNWSTSLPHQPKQQQTFASTNGSKQGSFVAQHGLNENEIINNNFNNIGQFKRNSLGMAGSTNKTAAGLPVSRSLPVKIRRERMTYTCKFGEQGMSDGQFAEPSGVAVNELTGDIVIADANNHRVQVFDKTGAFKFHFGDGKLKFPNRVAISKNTGEYVVSERPPVHQIQVYNKTGQFVVKFGAKHLKHPRGLTVDHHNRVVVVECKVMRVFIFNLRGDLLRSFDCSQQIQFPNAVAVSQQDEIYISDNRSHCVKVFNFQGQMLRQIGGSGVTNYPIGVCLDELHGLLWVIDNYNNLNVTIFRIDGSLVAAFESSLKHQQCLDVAMQNENSIVVTSKDLQVYIYNIKLDQFQQQPNFNALMSSVKPINFNAAGLVGGQKFATTARHLSGGTTNL